MQSQKPALLESERRKSRKNVDDGCHGKKFIVSLTDDLGHVVRRNQDSNASANSKQEEQIFGEHNEEQTKEIEVLVPAACDAEARMQVYPIVAW